MNPALNDNTSLAGTGTVTIAAADVVCDNEWEVVMADGGTYYFLTFTGCEAAPAAADPLPDTGVDATALVLAAAGLLAAGVATIVVVRRRNA
jgi:LPXTG-motif cell wall-anchored protein